MHFCRNFLIVHIYIHVCATFPQEDEKSSLGYVLEGMNWGYEMQLIGFKY